MLHRRFRRVDVVEASTLDLPSGANARDCAGPVGSRATSAIRSGQRQNVEDLLQQPAHSAARSLGTRSRVDPANPTGGISAQPS